MTGSLSLLRCELRRHAEPLLIGWLGVALLPLAHRLAAGHWGYRASGWGEAGALFVVLVAAPLLAVALSLRTWAGERASGTLLWLYAHPLSAAAIFRMRVAAVGLTVLAFLAGGLAVHLGLLGELAPWLAPGLVLAALGAAGGLCASAVAPSPDAAARGLLAGAVAAAGVASLLWLPAWEAGLWRREAVLALACVQGALWALGLLRGAWGAVREAPAEPGRWRPALRLAAVPLLLGLAPALVPPLFAPSRLGAATVVGGGDLGGGARLELVQTPAMHPLTVRPRVVRADGGPISIDSIDRTVPASVADAFIDASAGKALLLDRDDGGWFLIDRSARVHARFLPSELDSAGLRPVGWSPGGERFAWLGPARGELVVLEDDLAVRRLALPPGGRWTASWLDDRRLRLTPPPAQGAGAFHEELIDLGSG